MMTDRSLRGVVPILITPFLANERIDFAALKSQVHFLSDHGIQWVGIGFGSEVQRLDSDELENVIQECSKKESGVRVLGNADATNILAARSAIQRLHAAGAEAVLLRPSTISGLGPAEVVESFRRVADDSPIPIIIQDAAEMTGLDLSAETIVTLLAEVPTIVGVKIESRAAATKISRVRRSLGDHEGIIFGGSGGGGFALELARGVDGTMPGPAFPELFLAIEHHHRMGDRVAARRIQAQLLPLLGVGNRSMDTFIYSQKHVLLRRGVISDSRLRTPHAPLGDEQLVEEFDLLIDDLQLPDVITKSHQSAPPAE